MGWSTRAGAIAALRSQLQDSASPQRYTDTELGVALDQAVDELSRVRPIMIAVTTTVPADRVIRLDTLITAAVFRNLLSVVNTTLEPDTVIEDWYSFEEGGQHKVLLLSNVPVGDTVALQIQAGYGFALAYASGSTTGTLDTNIPGMWRDRVLQGAEAFALDLYGAREVGRANIAPAVAQQTARVAQVKRREFDDWLRSLPFVKAASQTVVWGLSDVEFRL